MPDLSGQVVDGSGAVSGATVVVIDLFGSDPNNWIVAGSDTTDSNGNWTVDGLSDGEERYHAVVQYKDGSYYNAYSKPYLTATLEAASYAREDALFHGIGHNTGETGTLLSSADMGDTNSYSYITDDLGNDALQLTHLGSNTDWDWGVYWGPFGFSAYDTCSFRWNHTQEHTWTDLFIGISEEPVPGERPTWIDQMVSSTSNSAWANASTDCSGIKTDGYIYFQMRGSPNSTSRYLEGAISNITLS